MTSPGRLEGARCADSEADPELWHSDLPGMPMRAVEECRLCPALAECVRETDRLDGKRGADIVGVRAALTAGQRLGRRVALVRAAGGGRR